MVNGSLLTSGASNVSSLLGAASSVGNATTEVLPPNDPLLNAPLPTTQGGRRLLASQLRSAGAATRVLQASGDSNGNNSSCVPLTISDTEEVAIVAASLAISLQLPTSFFVDGNPFASAGGLVAAADAVRRRLAVQLGDPAALQAALASFKTVWVNCTGVPAASLDAVLQVAAAPSLRMSAALAFAATPAPSPEPPITKGGVVGIVVGSAAGIGIMAFIIVVIVLGRCGALCRCCRCCGSAPVPAGEAVASKIASAGMGEGVAAPAPAVATAV